MNEAELLENASLAMGNGLAAFAVFVSMLAAYFTVAYVVGNKLDFRQLILVNFVFVISMLGMSYVIFGFTKLAIELYGEFGLLNDSIGFQPYQGIEFVNLVIDLVMIGAGLMFMSDRRASANET